MRTGCVLFLLLLWPAVLPAQVIPAGATPDEVLRVLGQPRTRSIAKEREIWRYADHQVIFEFGRLTALVALPDDGGVVTWKKAPPHLATAPAVTRPERSTPGVAASAAAAAPAGRAMLFDASDGKRSLRSPERSAPPVRPAARPVWPAVAITFVLTGGAAALGGWWFWRRQRRREAKTAVAPAAAPVAPPAPAPVPAAAPASVPAAAIRASGTPFPIGLKPPSLVDWELTPELLQQMEWRRFELLVQRFYGAAGLQPRTHLVGADGGVDIFLYRQGATRPICYVQCRSWGQIHIDAPQVRELFNRMTENRVPEAVIVTTGTFSVEAGTFAQRNRIALVNAAEFIARFNRLSPLVRARILTEVTEGDFTTPSCPRCGSKLFVRERAADGSALWGCTRVAPCHYTVRPVATEAAAVS